MAGDDHSDLAFAARVLISGLVAGLVGLVIALIMNDDRAPEQSASAAKARPSTTEAPPRTASSSEKEDGSGDGAKVEDAHPDFPQDFKVTSCSSDFGPRISIAFDPLQESFEIQVRRVRLNQVDQSIQVVQVKTAARSAEIYVPGLAEGDKYDVQWRQGTSLSEPETSSAKLNRCEQ